jgi:hypothetical protein
VRLVLVAALGMVVLPTLLGAGWVVSVKVENSRDAALTHWAPRT